MDVQYATSGVAGRSISVMLTNLSSESLTMPARISQNIVADTLSTQALTVTYEEATRRINGAAVASPGGASKPARTPRTEASSAPNAISS